MLEKFCNKKYRSKSEIKSKKKLKIYAFEDKLQMNCAIFEEKKKYCFLR